MPAPPRPAPSRLQLRAPTGYPGIYGAEFRRGPQYTNWRPQGSRDLLLLFTLGGAGRLWSRSPEAPLVARTGCLAMFELHAPQAYLTDPETRAWHLVWVHFLPRPGWSFWRTWNGRGTGVRWIDVPGGACTRAVAEALRECGRWTHSASDSPYAADFAFNSLERAFLWTRAARPVSENPLDDRVRAAMDFLQSDLHRPFRAEDVARHVGLSTSRLTFLFRSQTSQSPQQFAEQHKLLHASHLLRLSSLRVQEIAEQCGFANPFYFTNRFRRHFKLSPSAFRRRLEQGMVEGRG